jgi:outer membrane protein assembly factor BamB/PKD repeat protein
MMKLKTLSILITIVMVANIFGAIAKNVGQPNPSSSGTSGLADSPWPMFRQNLNHTGLSPYDTSGNPGKLKWSFTTGDNAYSSPAIGSDGTIYVGSDDNKLYAINPDSTEKWSFTAYGNVRTSPAIGFDGTIYVSDWNYLHAINHDGTKKWNFFTKGSFESSSAIGPDGTIYVGSFDYKLYAINPDGTEKWNFTTGSNVRSSPAIDFYGTIYIGSDDSKLYAIYPNGTKKWSFTTGWHVRSSPAIGPDGTIYIGSYDKKFYAINTDGTEKWSFKTGNHVKSSPAIGPDGTIYIGSDDYKLYAFYPNGTEKWSFIASNGILSSPSVGSEGTIYACDWNGKLYAINPDGTEKWSFMVYKYPFSSPAIGSDGTIYVGSQNHKLYAIGTPKSPPIADAGPDQTVNEGNAVQFKGCNSTGLLSGDPPSINPSVVALWHMDEGNGSIIYDETANNNDGTINGPTWYPGMYGSALKFEDTDLVYEIPASFDDSITTDITMVAWVYWEGPHPGTYSPNSYIFDARDFEGTRGGFIIYLDPSGTLIFLLLYGNNAGDYQIVQSTCKVPIKRWTHIAGVLDFTNGELRLYINGNEDTSVPATEPYYDFGGSHWDAAIGNNRYAPGDNQWAPFNGIIDEVVIYNEALTAQELPSTPAKIISYKWDFDASDGIDWDNPDATGPAPTHVYGDDGVYTVTLKITDETGATATDTSNITALNIAPTVDPNGPYSGDEGSQIIFTSIATDPGSDDLTFTWNWGDGTTTTTTYFNDGVGLEPIYDPSANEIKSPWGIYPFNVTDTVNHTYGDNGIYMITLTVEDDDNGTAVIIINVTVNNVAPNITLLIVPSDYEGSQLTFEAEAIDPGSDDLIFSWEFEYGPTIENICYNDGVGPEPIYDPITNEVKSPGGISPFNVSDTVTHTYGDNYEYFLTLRVKDDDDGMTVINTKIAVDNIAPSITKFAIPLDIFEGSKATFQAAAKDLGSDDLTFAWEFEQGPSITNTYYNDGMSPDPCPSPWGNFSFIAQDTVDHIFGDNGEFYVMLTVTDDDNDTTTFNTTVTVNNVAPKVDALPNATIDEGGTVTLTGHAIDPGSDDLTFTWSWEYAPWGDKSTIY